MDLPPLRSEQRRLLGLKAWTTRLQRRSNQSPATLIGISRETLSDAWRQTGGSQPSCRRSTLGDTDWRDPFAQASEMSREHRQSRKRVGSIGMNGCGRSATRTGLAAVFPGNREKYREKSGKEPLKSL